MNTHNRPSVDDTPPTQIEEHADADPRLLEAVREYQSAIEKGQKPKRREFLARYADLAPDLADCLDGLDFVHSAAPRLARSESTRSARDTPVEMLHPEQPLGDFRIVRELGRGGMGVVYEAQQLSLGRRVALKVLPFAATLDARQLQRFKTEAQAAAQLHHGNIVPVFFVGSDRGVHFYAMQYIEGQTLAALIADLSRRAHPPRLLPGIVVPDLPETATLGIGAATIASQHSTDAGAFFASIAQLGLQAAEALEHAHQMGVIHRDVKPANLLLDGRGHLWITDFGLARVQTDSAITATGDIVGTLRYMSPEQALGKPLVDQRTDVYSLGATLYELLTLTPLFEGRNRQEFLQQIVESEPPSPRMHNAALPVDLETIVLKALCKAPEERYGTAQELADDLRRFLEDKPIHARRPTLLEKASKWSRRHRTLVGSGIVLLLAAVLGLSVLNVFIAREQSKTQTAYNQLAQEQERTQTAYDRLTQEQERTKAVLASEKYEHDRAATNLQKARQVLEFFTQVTEDDLADKPGVEPIRRKLLETSLAYYRDFIEEYHDDPGTSKELADTYLHLAELLNEVGARADAIAIWEQGRRFQALPPPGLPNGLAALLGPHAPPPMIGPAPPGNKGFSTTSLLAQHAVQQDVKLSPEQLKEIERAQKVRTALLVPSLRGREHGEADRAARVKELTELDKAIVDHLRPEQAKRLQQLIWQQRGTHALCDTEVADALELTPEQRKRVCALQDDARQSMLREGGSHAKEGDNGRRSEEYWKKVGEKTLLVLTVEQRNQWKMMLGDPFKGEARIWPARSEHRD